jgi:hypothetical protein
MLVDFQWTTQHYISEEGTLDGHRIITGLHTAGKVKNIKVSLA